MFTTSSNPRDRWPLVLSLMLNGLVLLTLLMSPHLKPRLIPLKVVELDPVLLEAPALPKLERSTVPLHKGTAKTATAATSTSSSMATVGSARWRALAARGNQMNLQIVAFDSLPMLESYGVTLALDLQRPRGMTYLYRLRSGPLVHGVMPDGVIVRELELGPGDYPSVRKQAEQYLGGTPRVFALYEPDLYNVLKSLTDEALREHGIAPESVTTAHVRVKVRQGKTFSVSLVS